MNMNTPRLADFLRAVLMHPWGIPAIVTGLLVVFLGGLAAFKSPAVPHPGAPAADVAVAGTAAPPALPPPPDATVAARETEVIAQAVAATALPGQTASPLLNLDQLAAPAAGPENRLAAADPDAVTNTLSNAGSLPLGCLIEASAVAEVGTPVIGIIDQVLVERGDTVQRGQVMAQHESRVERAAVTLAQQKVANSAELRAAQSQSEFAERKAKRTMTLTDQNYVSGQAREQAVTESTMARMRLEQAVEQRKLALKELEMAKAQLQQRTIVSPLNGVVVDRLVSPGERVENRPVFKVAQIDPLRVEVVLPSSLFGRIQVGHTARVVPEMPGGAALAAQVSIVDRVVDAGSNTFRARLTLPNPARQVPAGVRCKIDFGG